MRKNTKESDGHKKYGCIKNTTLKKKVNLVVDFDVYLSVHPSQKKYCSMLEFGFRLNSFLLK